MDELDRKIRILTSHSCLNNTTRFMRQHKIQIRVRYQETDAQGRVHHANYLTYFEMGRVEFLRAMGHSYRELEASGIMLVVAEMQVQYYMPACYDDELTLLTTAVKAKGARIHHAYRITRGDDLLVTGNSTIACIATDGRVRRLPDFLLVEASKESGT
jgi:acyl-CoA thioester hydrolase